MDKYEKLALNEEQKAVLAEFKKVCGKCVSVGLYFVSSYECGMKAYNANDVSCFNAPENASYDNGKEEIDISLLEDVFPYGMVNHQDLMGDTNCLVAFD